VLEKTVPSLTLSYSNRANAEQAIVRGKLFKEKLLNVSIYLGFSNATWGEIYGNDFL
jgi:hypothetical protein